MKVKLVHFLLFLLVFSCKPSETIIDLNPSDSMSISGKGSGQNAVNNPYAKGDSIAIITNIGENNFDIRIETNGIKLKRATIKPNETKEVELLRGQQLFFDSRLKSKAKITFKAVPKFF